MSDKECIYREDAIAALANYLGATSKTAALSAECILKPIPAAPVREVRKGRWLSTSEYCKMNGYIPSGFQPHWYCSECEKGSIVRSYFCPNCGADMRAEEGGPK